MFVASINKEGIRSTARTPSALNVELESLQLYDTRSSCSECMYLRGTGMEVLFYVHM